MAAYRLVPSRHGEPVIAELRIFPLEAARGRPAGRWSAEVLGIEAKVPDERGISADLVRKISVGEHRQVGLEFWRWLRQLSAAAQTVSERRTIPLKLTRSLQALKGVPSLKVYMPAPAPKHPKRGRPPLRSDAFYARIALDYTERVAQGSPRPTAAISQARNLPQSKVRDMVHQARRRGLLSEGIRGRLGGQLTERGRKILEADRARSENE